MWSHSYGQNVSACLTWHLFASCYRKQPKCFAFDHCFYSVDTTTEQFASQDVVFDCLGRDILDNAFQGYNACIFAYGQTGECFSWFSTRLGAGGGIRNCVFYAPSTRKVNFPGYRIECFGKMYRFSHGGGVWSIRYSEEIYRLCDDVTVSAFLRPKRTGYTENTTDSRIPIKVVRRTFGRK